MAMTPQNWLFQEHSKEWLNRNYCSSLLVDHMADMIIINPLLWHACSMPSNLVCFLSFPNLLLSSGIHIIHLNFSVASDRLLLSPFLTIQVSYWIYWSKIIHWSWIMFHIRYFSTYICEHVGDRDKFVVKYECECALKDKNCHTKFEVD